MCVELGRQLDKFVNVASIRAALHRTHRKTLQTVFYTLCSNYDKLFLNSDNI